MDPQARRYGARRRPHRLLLPLLFLILGMVALPLAAQEGTRGVLALAIGGVLYVGIFLHIHVGLALLVILIGLSPEFEVAGIPNLRLEDLFIPVVVMAWVTRLSLSRQRLDRTDLAVPIAILIGLSAISSLLNFAWYGLPLLSSILIFGKTVEYYLIFLVVMNVVKTREQVIAYAFLLLAVSFAGGILGLHDYLTHGFGIAGEKVTGPAGETANIFGGYLVFHVMLAVGMAISIPNLWVRVILSAYVLATMVPMLYTFSRTTFAAFLGGLVSLALLRRGRAFIGVAVLLILLPVFFPEQVTERMATIFRIFSDDPPPSWEARVRAWNKFGGAVFENPVFGHGIGRVPAGYIDNEYVKQAHQLGLGGLIVFFWLLLRIFRTALHTIRVVDDRMILGFSTGFAAGFAAILIHNLGATSLTSIRIAEPFFFATGLLYAVRNHLVPKEGPAGEIEGAPEGDRSESDEGPGMDAT